jgi:hypothetical protein
MDKNKEYILCAAMYYDDGTKWAHQPKNIDKGLVICGRRHHNCFVGLNEILGPGRDKSKVIQGFMTNKDRFVDRQEAAKIAYECGQTKKNEETLLSECLY